MSVSSPRTWATRLAWTSSRTRTLPRSSGASERALVCAKGRQRRWLSTRARSTSSTRRRVSESMTTKRKETNREETQPPRRRSRSGGRGACHHRRRNLRRYLEGCGEKHQGPGSEHERQGQGLVRRHLDVVHRAEAVPGRDRRLPQEGPQRDRKLQAPREQPAHGTGP